MQLNSARLIHYLCSQGWLSEGAYIGGDVVVIERELRHASFTLEHADGGGVFVKQCQGSHPEPARSLQFEAAFYRWIEERGSDELRCFVPDFVGFDQEQLILAIRRVDGVSLLERVQNGGSFEPVLAECIGHALGVVHRVRALPDALRASNLRSNSELPWAFFLPALLQSSGFSLSGAARQLSSLLSQFPGLAQHLAGLSHSWKKSSLVHHDLKWENVLVASQVAGAEPGCFFIDWELAGLGDPAWDAATFLQAGIAQVCLKQTSSTALLPEAMASWGIAFRAFLSSWMNSRGSVASDLGVERARVENFVAVRLLHTVYEHAQLIPHLESPHMTMLQTAWRMLNDATYRRHIVEGRVR